MAQHDENKGPGQDKNKDQGKQMNPGTTHDQPNKGNQDQQGKHAQGQQAQGQQSQGKQAQGQQGQQGKPQR